MERVDIAIVGTGPAGISAALNAKIRHKSFYLFGSSALSDKVERSPCISNLPASPEVSGPALNEAFRQQLRQADIPVTQERITGIYPMGDYFALLADQKEYDAAAVILACGVETVKPLPGERELLGRGVSYCATCDGSLYRGKRIAVVCDNAPMEEEVDYLAGLAGQVWYAPLFPGSRCRRDNLELLSSPVAAVLGEKRVEGVRCADGGEIALDGVFFLKQSVSPAILLRGLEMVEGHVAVDRNMATSVKGCFAAGDCVGRPYQIAKAMGEGNIAAHSAFAYLAQQK